MYQRSSRGNPIRMTRLAVIDLWCCFKY